MACAATLVPPFALCNASRHSARFVFLAAVCAVAEGATLCVHETCTVSTVAAVLNDAQRRVCALGGRTGMPRSLGSVYAGSVVRFLGGCRGVPSRVIQTRVASWNNTMALTRDGTMLLVADASIFSPCDRPALTLIRVADGGVVRRVGTSGTGPLQFKHPRQVCIAVDEHVFVAELDNHRVQVLTPTLDFHSFLGVDQLQAPIGVCADADTVFVSEHDWDRISVFARNGGALLRRFGSFGAGDGQLSGSVSLCLVGETGEIAVADYWNRRVSVFRVDGSFVRHAGVGQLRCPIGVACSDTGHETVVADKDGFIAVFDTDGEPLRILELAFGPTGVFVQDGTIYAHTPQGACTVFA
jgi:hypothetical protein